LSSRGSYRPIRNTTLLFQAPVPHTIVPERERIGIITYTVQANDTLWSIGQAFNLQVETLMWANPEVEADPDLLSVGQRLDILPVDGIYYTVKAGDTVEKLAKTYKTTADKITGLEFNRLSPPHTLTAGQKIILVDGTKPVPPKPRPIYYPLQIVGTPPKGAPVGSGRFMWPVVGYWSRGFSSYHLGVDIANSIGKPVYAADDGYVMLAGQDTWGYGLQVIIDHGNGYRTRYAHLSKILVKGGQTVKRGEKIGLVGSTGRSTGPHLHFEIIKNGVRVDPTLYLPR
jgi:murein DD-endopeptidase MepM/ murein hydrolase activator NlpD